MWSQTGRADQRWSHKITVCTKQMLCNERFLCCVKCSSGSSPGPCSPPQALSMRKHGWEKKRPRDVHTGLTHSACWPLFSVCVECQRVCVCVCVMPTKQTHLIVPVLMSVNDSGGLSKPCRGGPASEVLITSWLFACHFVTITSPPAVPQPLMKS